MLELTVLNNLTTAPLIFLQSYFVLYYISFVGFASLICWTQNVLEFVQLFAGLIVCTQLFASIK